MRDWLRRVVSAFGRGWPGAGCPECDVPPQSRHRAECLIGQWDGGVWA